MSRKRITQIFPFLLPLRVAQRKVFFYTGMRLDGQAYAKTLRDELLPHKLFSADSGLYNPNTGFDMTYQENKVFNLKLAAKTLNGLLIKPGETFSFWQTVRHADKDTSYKDGLTITDGKLGIASSGGLCQMSNVLFWVLLHSPLTIVERHPHKARVPNTRDGEPQGVDATISEGWLDLKVKNETDITFQIGIAFDSANITGSLFTDKAMPFIYEIEGKDLSYFRENGKVYQKISIYRCEKAFDTREVMSESLLYENLCEIDYQLPEGTTIVDKGGCLYEKYRHYHLWM
jgi:vancomycin resistance protein VanW